MKRTLTSCILFGILFPVFAQNALENTIVAELMNKKYPATYIGRVETNVTVQIPKDMIQEKTEQIAIVISVKMKYGVQKFSRTVNLKETVLLEKETGYLISFDIKHLWSAYCEEYGKISLDKFLKNQWYAMQI